MSDVGIVSALWRYPVKSMLGEELARLDIEPRGIVGDRVLAVRNADGKIGSGKSTRRFGRVEGLLFCRASLDGDTPWIELPDGTKVRADAESAEERLAAALGQPLSVVREEAVSHLDAAPVHLLTTASLRWLADRLGEGAADVRRFRPNVVVDVAGTSRAEEAWVGRTLRCGEIELRITERTVRCVMTTLAQRAIEHAPAVLGTLAADNDACLGVYAEVVRGGTMRVGDALSLE